MELKRCFWKVYCKKSAVILISILFRSRESYLCVKDTGLGVSTVSVDCRRPRGKICKYVKRMIRKAIGNFFCFIIFNLCVSIPLFTRKSLFDLLRRIFGENEGLLLFPGLCWFLWRMEGNWIKKNPEPTPSKNHITTESEMIRI